MKTSAMSAALFVAVAATGAQAADDFPNKPIKMLVGATAGGGSDLVARIVALHLSKRLGQQVVVENRPGAGGNIANLAVARAPADGYTLAMAYSGISINPAVMQKMPFDTAKELAMVSQVADVPMGLYVNAAVPAQTVQGLINAAKSKPGQYSLGVNALASVGHLATEMFKQRTGVDMPTVVYKGSSAAMTDLIGGNVSAMFDTIASAGPSQRSGRIRILAVGGQKRMDSMPNVPTVAESGIAGFEMVTWYGLWAPGKLPEAISKRLTEESAKAMRSALVTERLGAQGFIAAPMGPAQFAPYITKEIATYARIVRDAKIQID